MAVLPFDDRDGLIWFNGSLVPWREAKVHVLSHGLHYASCVFEGLRVYDSQVFKATEHNERLRKSADILDFQVPYSVAELDAATHMVAAANNATDGYIRSVAWRGSDLMGVSAQGGRINTAITFWLWPSYFLPEGRMQGIRLTIADWRRPAPNTAPTASKAAGLYMICTLSKHAAEKQGFDDALLLDWRGLVAESTGANIFFAKDGKLHTPTPDCFLDGITRRTVMELARKRQIQVVERAISPEEMQGFDEAFLCGTAAEITPIREIGPYTFTPGNICHTFIHDYEQAVRRKRDAA